MTLDVDGNGACCQEDCSNMWSLSRPLLSLILINEEVFNQLKSQFIAMLPSDKQQHASVWLEKLMDDVQRNLEPKNRDKFSQVGSPALCMEPWDWSGA